MPESPVLLVMDFRPPDMPAPPAAMQQVAQTIAADTPGLLWKIWTQHAGRSGGGNRNSSAAGSVRQ